MKQKKNSVFNQSHLNPYHINSRFTPKRVTKSKFEDENYKWERLPAPIKSRTNELIKLIENEELEIIKKKGLKRDQIRLGDKIEVEYYHSITSKKLYKYRGVVIALKRQNSLSFSFKFLTVVTNSYIILDYPYYSPMLHSVKVISKSNIKNKTKIHDLKNIKDFGMKLDEVLKGGKKVNVSKRTAINLRKIENSKESIVIE